MSNYLSLNFKQLITHCLVTLDAGLVPYIAGSPGCGKSSVAATIAKKRKLKLIDIRLGAIDPTVLDGVAVPNQDRTALSMLPLDMIPLEDAELPEGYDGWLVLLDELPTALPAVQAATYKFILDHKVGQANVHSKVHKMAAGNLITDGAVAKPITTALGSRLIHFGMKTDYKSWLDWGTEAGLNYRVLDYIATNNHHLNVFDPAKVAGDGGTFRCERTWEFLSDLCNVMDEQGIVVEDMLATVAGAIGNGGANEFMAFIKYYDQVPKLEDIVANPSTFPIPPSPAIQVCTLSSIINSLEVSEDLDKFVPFIDRMAPELKMVFARRAIKSNRDLRHNPIIGKWTTSFAALISK